MGRPLNKKFFGDGATLIACNADLDGSGSETAFIVEQRSNTKYRVQSEAPFASNALVIGVEYIIVTVGTGVWADAGASAETIGTVFTATATTNGQADGTADARAICTLVDATPGAINEMQVVITPENAQSTVQATVNVTASGGAITVLTINNAGYGYWVNGTAATIAGGTAGTCDYTVDGNGSLATVTRNNDGSGYADGPAEQDIGDAPAANPPVSNARIINARTVKNFGPNSTTYDWPITAPLGSTTPGGRAQADLQSQ